MKELTRTNFLDRERKKAQANSFEYQNQISSHQRKNKKYKTTKFLYKSERKITIRGIYKSIILELARSK